jgi:hypothetical protein
MRQRLLPLWVAPAREALAQKPGSLTRSLWDEERQRRHVLSRRLLSHPGRDRRRRMKRDRPGLGFACGQSGSAGRCASRTRSGGASLPLPTGACPSGWVKASALDPRISSEGPRSARRGAWAAPPWRGGHQEARWTRPHRRAAPEPGAVAVPLRLEPRKFRGFLADTGTDPPLGAQISEGRLGRSCC